MEEEIVKIISFFDLFDYPITSFEIRKYLQKKVSIPDTKIWLDCIKCKHFPICDEVALLLKL